MHCGDRLMIHLTPEQIGDSEFEITYKIYLEALPDKPVSQAKTRHVCINPTVRQRQPLSVELLLWLEAMTEPAMSAPADD
jgi:1,4-dihydroxy-2-naphthoyl-CoA hydrolase